MYSNLPNLVIGFHGCDKNTYHNVLYKHHRLMQSKNPYDWLGNGIYFWENSLGGQRIGRSIYANDIIRSIQIKNQKNQQ